MNATTPTQESRTDLALIQSALDGHPEAFGELIQKYRPRFLGMATSILKSREEADDVLQDAFIQAYRHLAGFQNKARFSTWLYSIVLNHIRNRLRHGRVIRWVPLENASDPDEPWEMNIPEKGPGLDVVLDHQFQINEVHEAIKFLPPSYQAICVLHYFKGMLLKDVAEKLNCPLGTVKVYLHRARKLMCKRLSSGASIGGLKARPVKARPATERETDLLQLAGLTNNN
jgi:RNA polymerase sigma-70 factor, ECF subfamily